MVSLFLIRALQFSLVRTGDAQTGGKPRSAPSTSIIDVSVRILVGGADHNAPALHSRLTHLEFS